MELPGAYGLEQLEAVLGSEARMVDPRTFLLLAVLRTAIRSPRDACMTGMNMCNASV